MYTDYFDAYEFPVCHTTNATPHEVLDELNKTGHFLRDIMLQIYNTPFQLKEQTGLSATWEIPYDMIPECMKGALILSPPPEYHWEPYSYLFTAHSGLPGVLVTPKGPPDMPNEGFEGVEPYLLPGTTTLGYYTSTEDYLKLVSDLEHQCSEVLRVLDSHYNRSMAQGTVVRVYEY